MSAIRVRVMYSLYAARSLMCLRREGPSHQRSGIQWISYFHGGDALHSFNRASFDTSQSPGVRRVASCDGGEEALHPVGTLVTIES